MIMLIFQWRDLRLREVEELAQGSSAIKWESQEENPGLKLQSHGLNSFPPCPYKLEQTFNW